MSGQVVTLFSKRRFDFSNLATTQTLEVPIVKAIDVSQYTEGTLLVRLHSKTFSVSGATIDVNAYVTSPSAEDPSSDFYVSSAARGTVQIVYGDTAPTLKMGAMTTNFGGMLRITVKGTAASSTSTIQAEISAELALKS